jgi:hypothetical protein
MRKKSLLTIILFLSYMQSGFVVFGQIGKLSFDFSAANQFWKMNSLNQYLTDPMNDDHIYSTNNPYLKSGIKFQGALNYQFATCTIDRNFVVYDASENTTTNFNTDLLTKANTLSFGVNLGVSYDNLSKHLFKTKYLQQIKFSNQIKFGYAQSNLQSYYVFKEPTQIEFPKNSGASHHLVGDLSLSVAFPILTNPVFSSIGLNVGYQFYKSGIILNAANQSISISNGTQVHLDFSGLYAGLSFTVGK